MKKIWVVEELDFDGDWIPSTLVELSRKEGRKQVDYLQGWSLKGSHRLKKYVREEKLAWK